MTFKSKSYSLKNLYPFVVPALNAIFSLLLIFAFNEDLYTNYVYLTAAISLIYLLLNMGLRLAVIKNNDLSENYPVYEYIKNILVLFIFCALVLSCTYSIYKNNLDINFIIIFVFGALNLLLCDVFLAFNNSIGRTKYAYLYCSILPKSLFIITYLLFSFLQFNSAFIYLAAVVSSLSGILIVTYQRDIKTVDSFKAASVFLPFRMVGEWGQIALYGLFMPSLIVYAEAFQIDKVKAIGIAIMISQPMSILYQGAITIKLKELRELSMSIVNSSKVPFSKTEIFNDLSRIGLVGTIIHSSILALLFLFLTGEFEFFSEEANKIIIIICSTTYINSLFGPNGTLLGLIGKSHYDAILAFFKLFLVSIAVLFGGDILMILIVALCAEVFGNILKNLYLGWRLATNLFFTLKPLFLSFGIMAVIKYAYF